LNLWNSTRSMLLSTNRISSVRINRVETCANAPEMMPEAMAAVTENMKNATCAGELATHRSNSNSSCTILRPGYSVLSAAEKAIIKAASGRNADRNCSISSTFQKRRWIYFTLSRIISL